MNKSNQEYSLLYHSAPDIPPPHSFHVMLRISATPEGEARVEFSREYTDREEIPPDEIEAEGFSEDDDFHWKGVLPVFWLEEMKIMVETGDWKEPSNTQLLLAEPGTENWLSPVQEKKWNRFAEELIQACLEEGGREEPMEMVYGELLKNNFFESVVLEWQFARKEIHVHVKGGARNSFGGRDWEEAEDQLKAWMEEESSGKDLYQPPKFKGHYWLVNGEIWLPEKIKLRGRVWDWVFANLPA
jgi:hypothetical protein